MSIPVNHTMISPQLFLCTGGRSVTLPSGIDDGRP